MKFTKMEGLGNDYVYINCFKENVKHPEEVAKKLSDRHFGIGSDGLILIKPSDKADFEMEMYNSDGSRSEMCGNGIRCVGKYVYDYGLTDKTEISVDTLAGIKYLKLEVVDGKVEFVTVNMGAPQLDPKLIPVAMDKERIVDMPVYIGDSKYNITCVSMGNPHCITFVDHTVKLPIEKIGPEFENDQLFPNRVNVEFVKIINRKEVKMRVWERGTGETLACGTGACAVTVACILNGLTEDEITVHLLGGDLRVKWDQDENVVYMTGPAKVVFDGELQEEN